MASLSAIVDTAKGGPAPYGLLSSAVTVIEDNSPHWANGFQYETLGCAASVALQSVCNGSASATAVNADGELFRSYRPFAIQARFTCSTMSRKPEELEALVREALELAQQKALEYEFWHGALAAVELDDDAEFPNRFLASDDAIDVTPTPGDGVKPKYGVALLEQALAECGSGAQGVIHASRLVATALDFEGDDDDVLRTKLGTPVVAGVGYSNVGPGGEVAPADHTWMYATGAVTVRLGDTYIVPDESSQAVDIRSNTTVFTAERMGAVTWDSCCHFAVLIDLSLDYD